MKVVINNCYGGFGLSSAAVLRYAELAGFKLYAYSDDRETSYQKRMYNRIQLPIKDDEDYFLIYWLREDIGERVNKKELNNQCDWFHERNIKRNDPILVQVVEELKEKSFGEHAKLRIVEIPDDVEFEISEYDGMEHIAESHRTWS